MLTLLAGQRSMYTQKRNERTQAQIHGSFLYTFYEKLFELLEVIHLLVRETLVKELVPALEINPLSSTSMRPATQ